MLRFVAVCLALTACVDDAQPDPTQEDDDPGVCPPAAGKLTIYALPPPLALDWTSPNALLHGVENNRTEGSRLVAAGEVAMGHSIGHVNVELDCGEYSIALTGQTNDGGADWPAATDGAGLLLRDTKGAMDDMATIGDREDTIADIAARQKSGRVSEISFVVNEKMCKRLKDFVDTYVRLGAYTHYNGSFRPRRMQGAGCAIFGAGVVDVGGLLRRSLFTPAWARSKMIGSGRIADFLGDGKYAYGGNLVAVDEHGTHYQWPAGVDVPVPNNTPVWIFTPVLDAWSGPEDHVWPIEGLSGEMATKLPFTIYNPQLMAEWAERVWTQASASGSATAFDVPWTASTVGKAHQVTYDAHCVRPQKLAYTDDNDNLFADSDAP